MSTRSRVWVKALWIVVALAALVAMSGCDLLGGSKTTSVSDANNLFHFKVPEKWLVSTEGGIVSVYADDRLPEAEEEPTALSILVLSSTEASTAPVADVLTYLIDGRAEQRGWTDVQRGPIEPITVGGRSGSTIDVTATGADGKPFDSRYYFIRSADNEAFVAAIAPVGKEISAFDDELASITEQWFWHFAEEAAESETESETPAP